LNDSPEIPKKKGGRPKGVKNKPKPLTKRSIKDGTITKRSRRAPMAREEIDNIEHTRVLSREKHPYDQILAAFLTPQIDEYENVKWLTLTQLSESFNVPLPTIREKSAKFNWIQQQNETERAFYAQLHEKALRAMADQLPGVQHKSFDNCKKVVHKIGKAIESRTSIAGDGIAEVKDLIATNKTALETIYAAAGVANSKAPAPSSDSFAMRLSQKEERLVMGPDGKFVEVSKKQTLLEMFQTRVLGQGEDEEGEA
jgi:hypothetical protein